jgi:hypothetical protein
MNLGSEHALANNDDESDDDLPPVEDLFRPFLHPTILDETSRTEPTSQHLDQLALNSVELQADRTKLGIGERQVDSPGRRFGCPQCKQAAC